MKILHRILSLKDFIKISGKLVIYIASFFGIISFIILIGREKIQLSAQILSTDRLTIHAPEEELNARYTYAGEEIEHLWKLKIRFINSGDKTIIGVGNLKNIIDNGINIFFPDETRLLKFQLIDTNFRSDLVKNDLNKIQIRFSQWRRNEYLIAYFYVAADILLKKDPFPIVKDREIIDSDVIIENVAAKKQVSRGYKIDKIPKGLSYTGKIILGFVIIIGLLIIFGLSIQILQEKIRFSSWRKKYLSRYLAYLDEIKPPLSDEEKKHYSKYPDTLPEVYWKNFDIKRYKEGILIKSAWDVIILLLGIMLSFSLLAIYIFMLIPF